MIAKKFRGKLKNKDYTVYGWGCFTDESDRHFIINDDKKFLQVDHIDVFTGLKDRKGVAIYDGDILWHQDRKGHRGSWIIYWRTNEYIHEYGDGYGGWFTKYELYEVEKIGNIYESPHLVDERLLKEHYDSK